MKIKTNEITELIKSQIENYGSDVHEDDVGTVISVGDGVVVIYGLNNALNGELLVFPGNVYGLVMNLNEDSVGAVLLSNVDTIKEGDEVRRTKKVFEVPVGDNLIGRVVSALGQPIDGRGEIIYSKTRPVERIAPGVMTRKSVDTPLQTGIKAIDAMIPIGRGQRELIIGDRQTGKTAVAIDTIINQKGQNVLCIYVAIGQKNSTVARLVEKLKNHGAMDYTMVVSASASEMAALQYIAPFTGVTMAEEWMEQGKDVLIVYDDLSKQAVAYRTLALLLEKYAGALPTWLMPEQVRVLPISDRLIDDAKKVEEQLSRAGIRVSCDTRSEKVGYKIREAQLEKIPYMLVIGDKEVEEGTVSVRSRKEGDLGSMPVESFLSKILQEIATKAK